MHRAGLCSLHQLQARHPSVGTVVYNADFGDVTTLVLSRLDYTATPFFTVLHAAFIVNRLQPVQNAAARLVFNFR
jgi:hypothetical protein